MIDALSKSLLQLKNRHFMLIDAIAFLITPILALALRLDNSFVLNLYVFDLIVVTIFFLGVKLSVLYGFGFYRRYWRYASIDELTQITMVMAAAVVLQSLFFYSLGYWIDSPVKNLPRSLPLLDGILSFMIVGGFRFSVRAVERVNQRHQKFYRRDRLLIVGAGSAGVALVQEMQQSPWLGFYPVAFIDDKPEKLNFCIRRLPVVGNRHKIPEVVRSLHIHRVIIAMPSVSGGVIREIVNICQSIGVPTSTLPGIDEILNGRVGVESIRDIKIEDLLRREPIQTDVQGVSRFLMGKKVLITGAGGSIGSELCRQILKCCPAEIMILGHGENSVFNIHQELERVLEVLIKEEGVAQGHIPSLTNFMADIRFPSRLEYAFKQFRPDIIFHAAAHKHVPLMELNAPEAITNNVLGTKNLLAMALRYNVKHFIMISTDKAVNPTSVMGASKRTAEMLVLQTAQKSGKPFVVVRFGNVLGSRGSVVPTFRQQIAAGGPITITHPDICRYFMTIPEAVQLVLQASVIGRGGEVFMLNMGQPVKIVDLAKDLICLSGYEVGKDIDIVFTGLRPGEKLFEELFIPGEQYEPTQHEKILIGRNASSIIPEKLESIVEALCEAARTNNSNLIVFLLKQLVPEYTPGNSSADWLKAGALEGIGVRHHSRRKVKRSNVLLDTTTSSHTIVPLRLGKDLRQELEALRIHYQPIVHLQTNKIIGFEALLRWQHPQRGLVGLAEFMPLVEETSLIIPIGWWVLREACGQMRAWQEQFPTAPPLTISVNLSAREFFQPDLIKELEQILKETDLDACSLKLEIAESVVIENPDSATATLLQLRTLGVQLQIDQLGIGYSFLSRLQRLPNLICYEKFNKLKVDRSLISQIDIDQESLEIVQKIVAIAHDLDMDITAAGVETAGQLAQLRVLECEYGQGYLFSKPVEGEAVRNLIGAQMQQSGW